MQIFSSFSGWTEESTVIQYLGLHYVLTFMWIIVIAKSVTGTWDRVHRVRTKYLTAEVCYLISFSSLASCPLSHPRIPVAIYWLIRPNRRGWRNHRPRHGEFSLFGRLDPIKMTNIMTDNFGQSFYPSNKNRHTCLLRRVSVCVSVCKWAFTCECAYEI